jgi:hypothetical protein
VQDFPDDSLGKMLHLSDRACNSEGS